MRLFTPILITLLAFSSWDPAGINVDGEAVQAPIAAADIGSSMTVTWCHAVPPAGWSQVSASATVITPGSDRAILSPGGAGAAGAGAAGAGAAGAGGTVSLTEIVFGGNIYLTVTLQLPPGGSAVPGSTFSVRLDLQDSAGVIHSSTGGPFPLG